MPNTSLLLIALIFFSVQAFSAAISAVGSPVPHSTDLENAPDARARQVIDNVGLEVQSSDFEDELVEPHQEQKIIIDSIQTLFSVLSTANKNISHKSLLTYEANGFITTYKLLHSVNDTVVKQQLMFMDGPKRQVIRNQNLSACAQGATRWGLWPTAISSSSFSEYRLKTISIERIANREAILFEVIPKDEHRYGYRYSVDRQTGLVLKAVTYYKDVIIERLQTVAIDFIGKAETLSPGADYSWRVPEVGPCYSKQFTPAWKVQWLPEGFEAVGNRITAQGEQVLIFADGLVSVSVFVVNSKSENLPKATARHGATVVVITPVTSQPGRSIAVVGEIPTATARKIAVSVKPI